MDYQDYHEPVLAGESVSLLVTHPGVYIDGTLGGGGHSSLLLRHFETLGGESLLVGIDQDTHALEAAGQKLGAVGGNYRLVRGNFGMVKELVTPIARGAALPVMGFLLDLGVSSFQIRSADSAISRTVRSTCAWIRMGR